MRPASSVVRPLGTEGVIDVRVGADGDPRLIGRSDDAHAVDIGREGDDAEA